jgi:hypothetical protein
MDRYDDHATNGLWRIQMNAGACHHPDLGPFQLSQTRFNGFQSAEEH